MFGSTSLRATFGGYDRTRMGVLIASMSALVLVMFALALPGVANAAFSVPSFSVTPSTTASGANPDLAVEIKRSGTPNEDLTSTKLHLPSGSGYSIASVPRCSNAQFASGACPANSQIGTSTARVFSTSFFGGNTYADGSGRIFALASGEVGVTYPVFLFSDPQIRSTISTSSLTGGPLLTAASIPRQLYLFGLFPIDITFDTLKLNFFGKSGSTKTGPAVITNPSTCGAATSTLVATSAQGANVTKVEPGIAR